MKRLPVIVALAVATLFGCGERTAVQTSSAEPGAAAPAADSKKTVSAKKPKTTTIKAKPVIGPEVEQVNLTGTIVGVGQSRGKTMAAWHGVPSGERYFKLAIDAGQARPPGASETTFLRAPAADRERDLVGKKVRVVGSWSVPAPVRTHLDDGAPLQVPIHMPAGPAAPSALKKAPASTDTMTKAPYSVVARQPIFSAAKIRLR